MLDEDISTSLEDEAPRFVITDDATADWAIEKIKDAAANRDRLNALLDEKAKNIADERAKVANQYGYETGNLIAALEEYFTTRDAKYIKKTKTQRKYQLASGDLIMKTGGWDYQYDDETAAEWLTENGHPELVETKRKPRWGEFKKTLTTTDDGLVIDADGTVIDFVTATRKEDKFEVK